MKFYGFMIEDTYLVLLRSEFIDFLLRILKKGLRVCGYTTVTSNCIPKPDIY